VTNIREFAAASEIRPLVGLAAAAEGGEAEYALPYINPLKTKRICFI
jgi:hypothetical protein